MTPSARLFAAVARSRAGRRGASMLADADVLGRGQVVAHVVLEDDADLVAQASSVVFAQVGAIEQDPALGRVVEPRQELDERRLAGAVLADQRDLLAGRERKAQIAHCPALGAGIAKADVAGTRSRRGSARERGGLRRRPGSAGAISKNEKRSSR